MPQVKKKLFYSSRHVSTAQREGGSGSFFSRSHFPQRNRKELTTHNIIARRGTFRVKKV